MSLREWGRSSNPGKLDARDRPRSGPGRSMFRGPFRELLPMAWNDLNADAVAGTATTTADSARVAAFLRAVYGWMFVGLAVTAAVAFYVASSPAILSAIAG